ncbi:MAG TPA: arylamine N-acetyltransferase [Ottowia sp.]|uniref:arylamine N-acetyltransferase family protein n=1 Tax=Ottowia sp. TaxID=1898956 RepID=UPI002BF19F9D|nr:arylamine N-acetyltransferase [Ottowia sp.]HMN21299.1 arylamine N-acetyltransferase [Ottowia sp.]
MAGEPQAGDGAAPIDLARYLARIGLAGPCPPTLGTLHALTAAHAETIPFENLDVLLERPIELAPEVLFDKLVRRRRGGYCFEQNGLLLAVLQQLGFDVRPLGGRVRLGQPDRRVPTQRTHMLLQIRIDGQAWITDVGVGTASLTHALRLQADVEQRTPHDTRRLQHEAGRWYHQIRRAGAWVDVYEFTEEELPLIDRKVGNWYTSTHPDSVFRQRLMASRAAADGSRWSLANLRLSRHLNDGSEEHQTLASAQALGQALEQHFALTLPAADVSALFERIGSGR